MKVVVQRVKEAKVVVDQQVVGSIGQGLLVFFGVHKDDLADTTGWLVSKLLNLRLFCDEEGKMNLSIQDIGGQVLVVSQFTLYGNCTNGRRPDFGESAAGSFAEELYNKFVEELRVAMGSVQTGKFGAKMEVSLINDGPVTFVVERK